MTDLKALHAELIHSVDWAASNQVAWTRNNRDALLSALELAQQAERLKAQLAESQKLVDDAIKEAVRQCKQKEQLQAQLAEAEKLNETWSLAYERAQQQLAAKERELVEMKRKFGNATGNWTQWEGQDH